MASNINNESLENYKSRMFRIANARRFYIDNPGELMCLESEAKLALSELEAMQSFRDVDMTKIESLVEEYDKALSEYDEAYANVYYYEIHGMCQGYEPTPDESKWLDDVNIWKNIVLSGKMTLLEATIAELLSFENTLKYYNKEWESGRLTSVVAVGYQIHIHCSDFFRTRVKNWLIEKGLIDPTLKGGYDKKYFA